MSEEQEKDTEFIEAVAWAERTDISHAKVLMKRVRFYERTHPWSKTRAPAPILPGLTEEEKDALRVADVCAARPPYRKRMGPMFGAHLEVLAACVRRLSSAPSVTGGKP